VAVSTPEREVAEALGKGEPRFDTRQESLEPATPQALEVSFLEFRGPGASNRALEMATGAFIVLLDHEPC
jgi:hypothetical protein